MSAHLSAQDEPTLRSPFADSAAASATGGHSATPSLENATDRLDEPATPYGNPFSPPGTPGTRDSYVGGTTPAASRPLLPEDPNRGSEALLGAGAGAAAFDEKAGAGVGGPARRRRLGLWLGIGAAAIVVVVLAVVLPVYFTVIKKHNNSSSGSKSGSGSGGSSGGSGTNPESPTGAITGGDGSTITMDGGTSFTYTNQFGGFCTCSQ